MEDKPEDVAPEKKPTWAGMKMDAVGTIVFLFSSVALVIFIVLAVMVPNGRDIDETLILRGAETILVVAALGIIISFLATAANALTVVITLLVVAALVIPSKDIVRFVLVATGSERSLDDFYGRSGISANLTSRVESVSLEIVGEIEKLLQLSNITELSISDREELVRRVSVVVQRDRTQTLFERVNARGVLELLAAVKNNEASDFLYRYRDVDRLQEDLQYLRYEGLISIAYDDVDSIRISSLGDAVLRLENTSELEIAQISEYFPSARLSRDCSRIRDVDLSNVPRVDFEDLMNDGYIISAVDDVAPRFLLLNILPGFVGTYQFDYQSGTPSPNSEGFSASNLDPRFTFFRLEQDGSSQPRNDSCTLIAEDDDGGGDLNSRISIELSPGWLLIRLGAFGSTSGSGYFSVTRL